MLNFDEILKQFTKKITEFLKSLDEYDNPQQYIQSIKDKQEEKQRKELQEIINKTERLIAERKKELELLPPLTAYEARKEAIQNSNEQIEGIFYIYNGIIILDYYSECLLSDGENPCRKYMYHMKFYPNYMLKKFNGLTNDYTSIPRGRVFKNSIYIDMCFVENTDTLDQIKELYRLPSNVPIITNTEEYVCSACRKRRRF